MDLSCACQQGLNPNPEEGAWQKRVKESKSGNIGRRLGGTTTRRG